MHDFCTLVGFGADGVCPYMVYDGIEKLHADGLVDAVSRTTYGTTEPTTVAQLTENYRQAIGLGLMKVMSKMGISTLQSYKGW